MSTKTSKHVRNYSLPYRPPSKHVVFSAIVKTDATSPSIEPLHVDGAGICTTTTTDAAPRSVVTLGDQEAKVLLGKSQFWPPSSEPLPGGYTFDTIPTLVKTPWELERSSKRWSRSSKSSSDSLKSQRSAQQMFLKLPQEICDRIVDHIAAENRASSSLCPDCMSHDLYSLSLVNKAFSQSSMKHLYLDIWIPSCQALSDTRTLGMKRRNPLRSLLRTLLKRPDLASRVLKLRASEEHRQMYGAEGDLVETLAAIILACPNLESLHGLQPAQFCPTEKLGVITSALTTRRNLREHIWMIDKRTNISNHHTSTPPRPRSASFLPVVDPSIEFIQAHSMWKKLETLVISATDAHLLGPGTLYGVLAKLPSLKHLMLSGLPAHICHNGTLQSLKSLHSLRLENLPGVTDLGLEQLSYSRVALSLQNLSLINLDIKSLRTISRIFTSFPHLTRFTLQQDSSPGLPLGSDISIALNTPFLQSPSLRFLHWDILTPGSANEALAHSLRTHGLPSLTTLRAPCDSDGVLQSLCRPIPRHSLTKDTVALFAAEDQKAYTRNLGHARAAAQLRIRQSRIEGAGLSVVVQDEGGVAPQKISLGAFVGRMGSPVEYCLEADYEGAQEAVGRIEDVWRGVGRREGCGSLERRGRKGHGRRSLERVAELGQLF